MTALLLALTAGIPQDEIIGGRWREWKAAITGRLQGEGDLLPGSNIDVDDTLGYDRENAHEIQLYLNIPVLGRFYAGYWWVNFNGEEILERTITFADRAFTAGTAIDSELELDMYYLTYEFGFPSLPLGGDDLRLDLGVQFGVRALLVEGTIESALFTAEDSGGVGIPVLGVHGALQVTPFLRAELEIAGMAASYGDSSLSYLEAFGEIVGQFGPLFAGVGYKWCNLDMKDDRGDVDFEVDLTLEGFYLTAGVRF
ncbi:MAG TPA: hypothetical protein VF950_25715 [Planctomycetota bacterium]